MPEGSAKESSPNCKTQTATTSSFGDTITLRIPEGIGNRGKNNYSNSDDQ
jgi:hypothetical protein